VRVELTRSGGLAAVEAATTADSAELPESEAERLRTLVEAIDLDELAQRSPLRGKGADRYQYDLLVSDEGNRREITASEDAAPPELRALVDWLLSRARD
jgi:hypothetical protein